MITALIPAAIISLLFIAHWVLNYPKEYRDALTFSNMKYSYEYLLSILAIIFTAFPFAVLFSCIVVAFK